MNVEIPSWLIPMWLVRKFVRRNLWLLGEGNAVSKSNHLDIWIWRFDVQNDFKLKPETREKLRKEFGNNA